MALVEDGWCNGRSESSAVFEINSLNLDAVFGGSINVYNSNVTYSM
jgi:hypothetical protein